VDLLTARLRLRPWSDGDTALLSELAAVPEMVRYVGDGTPWTPEHAAEVSERMVEHWRSHAFGWRVALPSTPGRAVGFIALNYAGEATPGIGPDEFEIGWWLRPEAWGQGYASEGARAIAEEAFTRLRAPGLLARIQPGNASSRRVAESLGMAVAFETVGRFGEPVVVYRI
jgi:RimJ/RimL family protein N-acetyltransferase